MFIIIRFVSISAYSDPDSAVSNNIYGKTWVLYYSLTPSLGSRIALAKDKQLEIAHAVIYCRDSLHLLYPIVNVSVAYLLGYELARFSDRR